MMSPWKENPILALYLFLYICGWDKNIPGSRRGLTNYCLALNLEIPLGVVMEEDLMVSLRSVLQCDDECGGVGPGPRGAPGGSSEAGGEQDQTCDGTLSHAQVSTEDATEIREQRPAFK